MSALRLTEETEFINSWMQAGACKVAVNTAASNDICNLRISLLDVIYVLKTGMVVRSDMLEERGLWDVIGLSVDGIDLRVQIAIDSAECDIEILRVKRVTGRSRR